MSSGIEKPAQVRAAHTRNHTPVGQKSFSTLLLRDPGRPQKREENPERKQTTNNTIDANLELHLHCS